MVTLTNHLSGPYFLIAQVVFGLVHYSPAGRNTQPVVKKPENKEQPVSLVQKKLEEAREKNKKRYQKK